MEVKDLKEKCKWCLRMNCNGHNIRYFTYSIKSDRDYLKKEIESIFDVKHIRYFTYYLKPVSLSNFFEKLESIGYEAKDRHLASYLGYGISFRVTNENYFVYTNKRSKKYGNSSSSEIHFVLRTLDYKTNISTLFDFIDKHLTGNYLGSNEWKYDICKRLKIPFIGKLSYLDPPGKYWFMHELKAKSQIFRKIIKN